MKTTQLIIEFLPTAFLLGIAWYWFKDFKDRLENGVNRFYSEIKGELRKTQDKLMEHSHHMGKFTKAVKGDMLAIQKEFLDYKQDLFNDHARTREGFAELEIKTKKLYGDIEVAITKFGEQFRQIDHMKQLINSIERGLKQKHEEQKAPPKEEPKGFSEEDNVFDKTVLNTLESD